MREHGTASGQTEMRVGVEIIAPLRKELADPGHLALVLGDVGLHMHVGMLGP